ncbi:DNA topoisomerase, partial [Staphylococcus epidermidis]
EKYYTLSIKVDGYEFTFNTQKHFKNKKDLETIEQQVKNQEGKVIDVKSKHKKLYPQQLYNLTDIQQDAYRRFKMGPKETLNTLQ